MRGLFFASMKQELVEQLAGSSQLPVEFQGELELASLGCGGGLARGASGAYQRVAELVHGDDVAVVEEVDGIGDKIDAETLSEVDAFGNARVELEEHGHVKFVAGKSADAAEWRSNSRNTERLEGIGHASGGSAERDAMNVRRCGATA